MVHPMVLKKFCKCGFKQTFVSGGLQPRALNKKKAKDAGWDDLVCPACTKIRLLNNNLLDD